MGGVEVLFVILITDRESLQRFAPRLKWESAIAEIRLESSPPERKVATGTSDTSCRVTASITRKSLQLLAAAGVAQLAQGLGFDLADALAGDVELLADLLQRAGAAVLEAEAQRRPSPHAGSGWTARPQLLLAQHGVGGGLAGSGRPRRG